MSHPDKNEQILQSHTGLIHRVVMHCNNPGSVPDMEQVLHQAEANDWKQLVAVIRSIMSGTQSDFVTMKARSWTWATKLKNCPGMVFTVEPGLYVPGSGGFRHSDTVLVTEGGIEMMTYYPRDLESLMIRA